MNGNGVSNTETIAFYIIVDRKNYGSNGMFFVVISRFVRNNKKFV